MKGVRLFTILLLVYSVSCRPNTDDYDVKTTGEEEEGFQNDNYDYGDGDDDGEEDLPDPILRTTSRDFIAKENQTVYLPCEIQNGDTLVSMWKKNNDLIFQDSLKLNSFGENFRIDFQPNNRTLIIENVGANETASYTCSMPLSKNESLIVTHRLFVQTAPKIVSLKAEHDVKHVDQGKTLKLTCQAIGYPKPTIKWSRKGIKLPEGETLTIENVGHHDSGDYQCLADNAIEPPAHKSMHIGVTQKPIVKIEKASVNTDERLGAELFCYVYGTPKPDVVWKKDGVNVVSSDRYQLQDNSKQIHTLTIKSVTPEDFGVYTCSAYNRLGKTEANVTLTAYPSVPELVKVTHKHNQTQLIWTLESKSPIIKYILEYKNIENQDWQSISPEVLNGENNIYTVNYTLTNLEIGKHYHARLRSQNTYGWSANSEVVKFVSARPHDHHKALQHENDTHKPVTGSGANGNEVLAAGVLVDTRSAPTQASTNIFEQKPHTQEDPKPAEKKGTNPNAATLNHPAFTLMCVTILSIIFSR